MALPQAVAEPVPTHGHDVERSIPRIIRMVLRAKDYRQQDLAAALHMNPNRLSERMNGKVKFTIAELVDIAECLGAPATIFFDRDELAAWVQKLEILSLVEFAEPDPTLFEEHDGRLEPVPWFPSKPPCVPVPA